MPNSTRVQGYAGERCASLGIVRVSQDNRHRIATGRTGGFFLANDQEGTEGLGIRALRDECWRQRTLPAKSRVTRSCAGGAVAQAGNSGDVRPAGDDAGGLRLVCGIHLFVGIDGGILLNYKSTWRVRCPRGRRARR